MITVFTPTYNRSSLLPRLFMSLCAQSYRGFEWLIVDDGSVDDTESAVSRFVADFPVRYLKKENGGKHTAINLGVREAAGELFFIADSDDYLPGDSLQQIAKMYDTVKAEGDMAGVAGLDMMEDGKIVGSGLPMDCIDSNALDIRSLYHVTGDLKEVFRTDVLREFPFPEIAGEKFCPEALVWNRIAKKYRLRYFNQPVYVAEYQEGGITSGITLARMSSPVASMMTYSEWTRYDVPLLDRMRAAINYFRFRACAKMGADKPGIAWYWWLLSPLGLAMHLNDRRKAR